MGARIGVIAKAIFAGCITRELSRCNEGGTSKLAHRIRQVESTVRGWMLNSGPAFDHLVEMFRHLSSAMQDDVLGQVTRGTSICFYRSDSRGEGSVDLLDRAIQMQRQQTDLIQEIKDALSDGRLSQDETNAIVSRIDIQRRELDALKMAATLASRRGMLIGA